METDTSRIAQIRALSEEQIAKMITQSATSLGLSERRSRLLASQAGKLKKKMQSMSDKELQKFASMFSQEQLSALFASIEQKNGH